MNRASLVFGPSNSSDKLCSSPISRGGVWGKASIFGNPICSSLSAQALINLKVTLLVSHQLRSVELSCSRISSLSFRLSNVRSMSTEDTLYLKTFGANSAEHEVFKLEKSDDVRFACNCYCPTISPMLIQQYRIAALPPQEYAM